MLRGPLKPAPLLSLREKMFYKQLDPERGWRISLDPDAWASPDSLLVVIAHPLPDHDFEIAVRFLAYKLLRCPEAEFDQRLLTKVWADAHARPIGAHSHPAWRNWMHEIERSLGTHNPQPGRCPLP